ncbi:CRISPR-associated helicase/endonuclease Cas3 [Salinibacter altiplanensis]|uniref:CRISPR-associated helicase/endonuclease Cas3 n=1 Tax=Salinibacter altiplanensis TaxID=1803181 RepID=UPI000C9F5F0A|nr:CRISPR-associated helicase/endonuclease Cas3 [Salinibacter altiplanensis]
MDGSPAPDQFWAKLKYKNDDRSTGKIVEWHPLLAHSADVAAVTEALLQRTILRDRLAALIGWDELSDVHVARLSALAALHDAGKVNHGFQNRGHSTRPQAGHVRPIVDVLSTPSLQEKLLLPLGLGEMMSWFDGRKDPDHFLRATWAHHGEPVDSTRDQDTSLWEPDSRNPLDELKRLGEHVRSWFPDAFREGTPFPEGQSDFQHAFNGVLTLADWIGSGFPYADDREQNFLKRAQEIAEERLTKQAMLAKSYQESLETSVGFSGILKKEEWTPHPVQEIGLSHPVYEKGGLTVLESDTGSGKTEAAIARFFRLYQEKTVDGMYFAVPTRTAAKQLYMRVYETVQRVYERQDADPPPVVQAVPSYYKIDGVEGTPVAPFTVRWHDEEEEDEARERRWAAEGPKRYLAGAIVVGTIDQVLLSALQVRHAHMRGAALLRHFLVVDEVHASDVYMTRLLSAVLDHHLAAGGHAMLMSATLGTESRLRLTKKTVRDDDIPPPDEATQIGYPLVTHVSAERDDPTPKVTEPSGYRKDVLMTAERRADDPEAIARRAIDAAREGARVLIIRNLVEDCRRVQEAIENQLGAEASDLLLSIGDTPAPHHSRYADGDRKRLDAAIEQAFGEEDDDGNPIPIQGAIAVATQTVQMSLDISASLMMTDLCPVDVLLQRIGRLHRHDRSHPSGFEDPECIVLTPEERNLSSAIVRGGEKDGQGLKGGHGLGTVYSDLRVLDATWTLLEDEDLETWTIPDDNRRLVERGTHPHVLRDLVTEKMKNEPDDVAEAWDQHQNWVVGERTADAVSAKHVLLQRHKSFGHQQFGEDLEKVKTRLGQDNVRVEFSEPMPSPLPPNEGPSISALSIPEHLLRDRGEETVSLEDLEADDVQETDEGFCFIANEKRFRYVHLGLSRIEGK